EDFRTDIYSLGATLFHALAGRPPFDGETSSAAELRALKNNPLQLSKLAREISPATASIIERMIAPDPRLRFPSYDELIAALENARHTLRARNEPEFDSRSRTRHLRRKIVLLAMAAAMIVLAGFG